MKISKGLFFTLLLLFFVITPGVKIGILDGIPLTNELDWFVLLAIIITWISIRLERAENVSRYFLITLISVAILKICLIFLYTPFGLTGKYYANSAEWQGNYERSVDYPLLEGTRIDDRIDFTGRSHSVLHNHFKLHFLNDLKYNLYGPDKPHRMTLPFSVIWDCYIFVPADIAVNIGVSASGYASLYINDNHLEVRDGEHSMPVLLHKGNNRVQLKYAVPDLRNRSITLFWDKGFPGDKIVITGNNLFPSEITASAYYINKIVYWINILLHLFMAYLSIRTIIRCAPTVAIAPGFPVIAGGIFLAIGIAHTYWRWLGPAEFVLSGGDDWLTYESFARSIIMDDTVGKDAFYYAPFYSYFLALLHLVFGEEWIYVIFAQYFLAFLMLLLQHRIATALFSRKSADISIVISALQFLALGYPPVLLATVLISFLLMAALYMIMQMSVHTPAKVIPAGLVTGLAIITRPEFLLMPLILVVFLFRQAMVRKYTLAVVFVSAAALFPLGVALRNYLVAGRFVLTTNMSVNLSIGNPAPPAVVIDRQAAGNYPSFIRNNGELLEVVEYLRQKPWVFIKGLARKFVYCFGFNLDESRRFEPVIIIPAFLFVLGLAWLIWSGRETHWLLLSIIILHIGILTIFFPWTYRFRLVAPVFSLMNIYGGIFLEKVYCFLVKRRSDCIDEAK
ncbi:MAG: hypothetical protein AB1599_07270 [Planctomycetota bacterium]